MKSAVKVMLWTLCLLLAVNISVREARAVDDNDGPAEEVLFSESLSPDVLLLIDLSGSMNWSASGGTPDSTNPSRLTIAKQAIFSLLDYNGDGVINSADSTGLNVRFGYMRFYGCSSSSEEQYGPSVTAMAATRSLTDWDPARSSAPLTATSTAKAIRGAPSPTTAKAAA